MTPSSFIALLPALLGLAASDASVEQPERVIAQSEFILRIPVRPRPAPSIIWVERDGPRCVAADDIRGAMLSGGDKVDFLLHDRRRVRALFSSECPALDFYSNFYITPEDDRICARRDIIRSRSGGSCRIEQFKRLVPKLKP